MKRLNIIISFLFIIFIFAFCTKIKIEKPVLKDNSLNCNDLKEGTPYYQEIPNLDFEAWTTSPSGRYQEPTPTCFWATPSKANDIIGAIPITVTAVTGDSARSGKYGCMMKTQKWGALLTAGTVASGTFAPNFQNPLQSISFGKPFNKKVKEVRGWYKFWSVQQDSCSFYCYQTRKLSNGQTETVCFDRIITHETKTEWTEFVLTPQYYSNATPESLVLYFASSEEGDELKGQVGNTLIVDDVSVTYY
ncbi:MAG: PCMD domain-containing protein [Chitinophagales bacterium]|nr:PCMD domain-containing protein [Chitinophagales bacterium]